MRISDWSSDVFSSDLLHKHACAISLCATSQSLKRTSVSVRSSLTAFELSFVPSGRLLLPVVVSALPVIPRLRSSGKYWYPASRARRVQTYGQGSSTGSWLLRPSGRRRLCLLAHTWTQ